jgi:tetratricopeptide (TPR) repeat protein
VIADLVGAATRYRLLESTRAYALERLAEAHERERFAERHLTFYKKLALSGLAAHDALRNRGFDAVGFQPEMENVRAALSWSLAGGDVRAGAETALAVSYNARVFSDEIIAWIDRFLAVLDTTDVRLRAELKAQLGDALAASGRTARAAAELDEAVALCRNAQLETPLLNALMHYVTLYLRRAQVDDGIRMLAEIESLAPATTSPRFRFQLLRNQAVAAGARGDFDEAVRLYRDIQAHAREFGNEYAMFAALLTQAEFEHARGETAQAITIIMETLPRFRTANRETLAIVLANVSGYQVAFDRLDEAAALGTEAVLVLESFAPDGFLMAIAIEHLALVLALSGDPATAARLAGYTDATLRRLGSEREFTETTTRNRLAGLLAELPADELALQTAHGETLSPDAAIAETLQAVRTFQGTRQTG